ncbi:toxin [Campylobacter fetus subsp. venerealis]|uniref:RICIN domain-containing protein n=1 Tax=Campylobacter fetus TaxID=196 RepID=UPI0018E7C16C|nr:RICIN domain-containing protein [Campylobacter fetus]QQF51748.1 toxin [Campylobacter fetus subsp. venerealis]
MNLFKKSLIVAYISILSHSIMSANSNVDPVHGPNISDDPYNPVPVFYNAPFNSDLVSIMAQNGVVITVWATAPLNWVWGYSARDSVPFGYLRIWRLKLYPKNYVQIVNESTKTCLSAYLSGVVHTTCDVKSAPQFWEMIPFDNGAVQFKNFSDGRCLQTDFERGFKFYNINLTPCVEKNRTNIDQQWMITAPTIKTRSVKEPLNF